MRPPLHRGVRARQACRFTARRGCDLAGIGLVPKLWAQDLPLRGQRRVLTDFPIKCCLAMNSR